MKVAPHKGAWIETYLIAYSHLDFIVAPHKGAWIETQFGGINSSSYGVAPHKGAWIETLIWLVCLSMNVVSRPTRARGLKRS